MKQLRIISLIALFIVGCSNPQVVDSSQQDYDEVIYHHGTRAFFETTLEELEEMSNNVVKGRLGNDARTIFLAADGARYTFSEPIPIYTATSLEILDVIHGDLMIGEIITIIEPYHIHERVLVTHDNYLPSIPNQEYFFFLGDQIQNPPEEGLLGAHFVRHGERGRYLVPDNDRMDAQSFSREELSLGEQSTELYMSLFQEVINAYVR